MRIEIFIDDESLPRQTLVPPATLELDTEGLADGRHRLRVHAIEDSGTVGVEEIPFTVRNGPGIAVVGLSDGDYVRVHDAEFIGGPLANGISLNEMMTTLKSDSFAATQRNTAKGEGNIDPRRAYRQQAAVELSARSCAWLSERFVIEYPGLWQIEGAAEPAAAPDPAPGGSQRLLPG
jgi:hypothetical protein